jgi:hypothetical protein
MPIHARFFPPSFTLGLFVVRHQAEAAVNPKAYPLADSALTKQIMDLVQQVGAHAPSGDRGSQPVMTSKGKGLRFLC